MPPRRPPPPKKKQKHQPARPPYTVDEHLALGVAHEETAEKWRAGDATKSARAYAAALAAYGAGRAAHPADFALTYNAARARFVVAQWPAVAREMSGAGPEVLLADALEGHEAALALRPDEPDVLFNTAQVLDGYADAVAEGEGARALAMRERAVALLGRCLELQETAVAEQAETEREAREQIEAAERERLTAPEREEEEEDDGDDDDTESMQDEQHGEGSEAQRWAFIEEPVTVATVLDTCVALADTLASACESAADQGLADKLPDIERAADLFLQQKAQKYIDMSSPEESVEVCTARAKTKAALLDAAFSLGNIDVAAYGEGVAASFVFERRFTDPGRPEFLCAQAETLVDFANTVAAQNAPAATRWKRLEQALDLLLQASKTTRVPAELSKIHISRGDIELLRLRITLDPSAPAGIQGEAVRRTLVQNAQKFYRVAKASSQNDLIGAAQQSTRVAQIKAAVALAIEQESAEPVKALRDAGLAEENIVEVVDDMVGDLLVPETLFREGLV